MRGEHHLKVALEIGRELATNSGISRRHVVADSGVVCLDMGEIFSPIVKPPHVIRVPGLAGAAKEAIALSSRSRCSVPNGEPEEPNGKHCGLTLTSASTRGGSNSNSRPNEWLALQVLATCPRGLTQGSGSGALDATRLEQ